VEPVPRRSSRPVLDSTEAGPSIIVQPTYTGRQLFGALPRLEIPQGPSNTNVYSEKPKKETSDKKGSTSDDIPFISPPSLTIDSSGAQQIREREQALIRQRTQEAVEDITRNLLQERELRKKTDKVIEGSKRIEQEVRRKLGMALNPDVQALINAINALVTALPAPGMAPPAPPVVPVTPVPKPPTPSDYDGNKDRARAFLREIEAYGAGIVDEEQRIKTVLLFFKTGKALQWADARFQEYQRYDITPAADRAARGIELPFTGWNNFKARFISWFDEEYPEEAAIKGLQTLRMGTGTAEDFISKFSSLAAISALPEAALVPFIKEGIPPALYFSVARQGPRTLDDWKREIKSNYKAYQESRELGERQRKETQTPVKKPPPPPPPRPFIRPNLPFRPSPLRQEIKQEEKDKPKIDRANAICFQCGKKGHFAADHNKEQIRLAEMSDDQLLEWARMLQEQDYDEDDGTQDEKTEEEIEELHPDF